MTKIHSGFTMIELMIVGAIIAILAAIAIPAYSDFATRSKISELLLATAACKVSVEEYYQTQAGFPPDQAASGCATQDTRYVSALVVGADGAITASAKTGPGAIDVKAAGNLELRPTVSPTGNLTWSCNGAGTTIPHKYLPAQCR